MDKQEQLVRTAFKLFYTRGINAVGVNLVLAESGIAKKTLYHHFPSKQHLVEAVIRYRDCSYRAWLISRLDHVLSGKPALLELFSALDDWFHSRVPDIDHFHGCFFINASAEFGDRDNVIHRACAEHKSDITRLIRKHVDALSLPDGATEELTRLVVLLKEGATSVAHVQGNLDAAMEAKKILENILHRYADE
ncbi:MULTISPECIES: TetR/AcrR family transcriptional regulator [unclassified Marinobacter]|uniref:TetR/AcrR family transcriptional regulator n=1 Tax=unclassified Marinobacter TaxID=83889 RepID=UPI000BF4C25B|nr:MULTISPECIES: TetR/AcrR family transcriptional regulator [unclassified Marinobacter]PFG10741.1 TetR family transcriptional regulator [Marinobacter sp. LV10MA510-1]PFG52635.1 TetR family transcriptional regulator [Marinobacter sp. LV10R520-4]